MDFAGGRADHGAAGDAVVNAGLGGIDVAKSEGIFGEIGGARVATDPVVIVLGEATELERGVTADDIIGVGVVLGFAEEGEGIEIGPTFAHSLGGEGTDASATADEAIAEAVSVFVEDDGGIEVAIAIWGGTRERVHLHAGGAAVAWGGEIGVIGS